VKRNAQPEPGASPLTEKAWNRLRLNGKLVRDEVTAHLPPELRSAVWEQFKQMPMARWACSIIQLLEPQPADAGLYRRRTRLPAGFAYSFAQQALQRHGIYDRLWRHAERLPSCPWLLPILAGRARDPCPEAHGFERGRRMRRIKGGKHVQHREQGWHPRFGSEGLGVGRGPS
jgi:hypothetical protein